MIIEKGEFSPGALLLIVGGAALLSNLLHGIVQQIPSVDVNKTFTRTDIGGNSAVFIFVKKIFGIYWKNFGPVLFIQSCCIGLYAGYRYISVRDKKRLKIKMKAPQLFRTWPVFVLNLIGRDTWEGRRTPTKTEDRVVIEYHK
ncbi:MAG: hypothetical protein JJE22_03765 [Bacteroidia bacterium]|nr:hypothetical protein [Bacteroidia bacterium]